MKITPEQAYEKALSGSGNDSLRTTACKNPKLAYRYALNIDKKPLNETRTAACKYPRYAYEYAVNLDNGWFIEQINIESVKPFLAKNQYTLEIEP